MTHAVPRGLRDPLRLVIVGFLRAYRRVISPMYGDVCRYYPSCSAYALEAVERHGSLHGSYLAARRVCRCHPWAAGGVDPVPSSFSWRRSASDSWAEELS